MISRFKSVFTRRPGADDRTYVTGKHVFGGKTVHAVFRSRTSDRAIFRSIYDEYGIPGLVQSLAGRPSRIIDIGGHIGSFSVVMAALLPELESSVYEFMPENVRMIQANIALNGLERRVRAFNNAVGDRDDGFVPAQEFAGSKNTGGVCIAYPAQTLAVAEGDVVPTISVKKVVDNGPVDVLKIDCEGSEYKILYSLDAVQFGQIGCITGEIHDGERLHPHETNGHPWKAEALLAYLGRFYRTVTVHKTAAVSWGFMQVFTARN